MGKNVNVIVASEDTELLDFICQMCDAAGLSTATCSRGDEFGESFTLNRPRLVCVDARMNVEPDRPLFHEIILHKSMRAVPMIVIIRPDQKLDFNFPQDQCVYVLAAGIRLTRSLAPVVEELIDIEFDPERQPHFEDGWSSHALERT